MSGISVSGLSSGVDWSALVTQLVNADRIPQTNMKAEQTRIGTQVNALGSLKTQLLALQTSLSALQGSSLFKSHSTTLSNSALGWSATAGPNTPNGTYSVNVTQLATAAARQGAAHVGGGLSATSDVSGLSLATLPTATAVTAGNFQINGATVSVAATDSLQDVFTKISTATGGAVTASYDPASDKVSLASSGGPVVLGASNDTSNFLSVFKLSNNGTGSVASAGRLGAAQLNKPLSQSNLLGAIGGTDASGNGTFSINGVSLAFNANTDTVQSVLNKINNSSAGVTASYDVSNDRFTLTNKTTGDLGLSASGTGGSLLDAMGLGAGATTVSGQDAHWSVNGGNDTVSHSNTLTDPSGLSVTATSTGTQTVGVGSDTSGASDAINAFVTAYNAVQTAIAAQTKITVGADGKVSNATLAGNHEITGIGRDLRLAAFASVPSQDGSAALRLQSMGIDFASGTSTLVVKDPAALANVLSTNGSAVANFFQNSANGLTTQLNNFVNRTTDTSGVLSTQTNALNKRSASLTAQIATMEDKLTAEQQRLTAAFTQMEQIQSTMQTAANTLTQSFTSTKKDS